MLADIVLDALKDTGKILPVLFLTYLLMEYLEHHAGGAISRSLQRAEAQGLPWAHCWGWFPSADFPARRPAFYAGGAVTTGTLLAVFLSTSDEMIPILISNQVPGRQVLLILGVKLLSGILVGIWWTGCCGGAI